MKPMFMGLCFFAALGVHPTVFAQGPATEKAEKRLADLLSPAGVTGASTFASQPKQWKAARVVEDISVPLQPYKGSVVRLPEAARKEVKPRAVPEMQPLVSYKEPPKVPREVELPTMPLIRLPSVDVTTPAPIPCLAQPLKDRASLGDPTLGASLDAALKAFTPAARTPIPFTPINLPDPFENLRAGRLNNPPEESPTPPAIPLQRPTR